MAFCPKRLEGKRSSRKHARMLPCYIRADEVYRRTSTNQTTFYSITWLKIVVVLQVENTLTGEDIEEDDHRHQCSYFLRAPVK
ncbi:hypothetical protein CEXT_540871 [Caerostris extrusa]|uniref:Uncharacterized protein n=1 Tax=Caerostris extrusa TaxID=172846 RepID=A0AAV4UG70_CAEEX|nr:hypothetical protein CEXT_540871 [Caerostris extrusa]